MSLKTDDGELVIIAGSSRCGKTTRTEQLVRPFDVAFIWDIDAQWHQLRGYKKVTELSQLIEIVTKGKKGKWCYVYSGNDLAAEFEKFCRCVFHYCKYFGRCAVVAEELADVSTPSKAPLNWGILIRRGMKRGAHIFAISQRWAEADKTAIGNATQFYCFMQNGDDVAYMSRKTRIPAERLEALQKLEYLHYVKSKGLQSVTAEKVKFS